MLLYKGWIKELLVFELLVFFLRGGVGQGGSGVESSGGSRRFTARGFQTGLKVPGASG